MSPIGSTPSSDRANRNPWRVPRASPPRSSGFDRAVELSTTELEAIVVKVAQQLGGNEADIFKSHLQIVNDQTLLAKVRSLIETQQLTSALLAPTGAPELRRHVRPD